MLANAQTYTITGRVVDDKTDEGLPFVNVYFQKNTSIGTSTDIDGNFSIETEEVGDSLVVSAIGYQSLAIVFDKSNFNPTINFRLKSSDLQLEEIVIFAGENPANAIVRNIIKNRKRHNIDKKESYECERYMKTELDLHNFDQSAFERRGLKDFAFILENLDSTSDEKTFLPAYINEDIHELYFLKRKPLRAVPKASRVSGIDASTVVRQVQRLHQPYNIYNNWIPILEKNFASPFSNLGLFYYEYYILDSAYIQNQWSYKLKFKPKRKQENTFFGHFWVADTTFAIQKVYMRKSEDVNINLVDRVVISEEYTLVDSLWLPLKYKMLVDFLPTERLPGLIARKTTMFSDFKVNHPETEVRYYKEDPEDFTIAELKKDKDYWESNRHEELTQNEQTIYQMVDSIKSTSIYQRYSDIVYALGTGWVKVGKLELGSIFNAYGGNPVEGNRFQLGLGTNLEFSTKYRGEIWGAWGDRDQRWKYGGKFQYNIKKQPRREQIGFNYFDDVIYTNQSSEEAIAGSSLAAFFRRDIPMRLLHSREAKAYYLKEFKRGWMARITALNRHIDPYGEIYSDGSGFNFQFINPTSGEIDTTATTTEFIFKIRHAYKEQFWAGHFDRISLGSKYPIYSFQYTAGIRNILGSQFNYHKLSVEYSHWIYTNPIGWLRYYFKAGKTFGTLPSLLLEAHPGNETFFYSANGYNVMNRYEFVSDTYLSWVVVHHFDGYILNKIPLLRKLDWRATAQFRGIWGTLTDENLAANALNTSDVGGTIPFRSPYPVPYMEAGVGVENIFNIFSLNAIWRLNYLDNPEAFNFMLQGSVYFTF
jgi:hypothetical protein